jgi:hypothetical protein
MRTEVIVLVILAIALMAWVGSYFLFKWKPKRKRWCVMFYLVAQVPDAPGVSYPDYETGARTPGQVLDDQLRVVVDTLLALPCATEAGINTDPQWDDVYVAYRAIWDKADSLPEARVVRPESSAPSTKLFSGETPHDISLSIDLSTDVKMFFAWAYENCPADQYAVFFWGHAMGPGGLFHQSEPPVVVSPPVMFVLQCIRRITRLNRWSGVIGLPDLREAAHEIVRRRRPIDKPAGRVAYALPQTTLPPGANASMALPELPPLPKVEIVLFQDCWMSTLETAFELQNDVRYIIGSQSLVPIGLPETPTQPAVVWEYKKLIDALLTDPNYAQAMFAILNAFFDVGGSHIHPNKKVLFALLDCSAGRDAVTGTVAQKFRRLVSALEPLGPEGRSKLIDRADGTAGRLYEFLGGTLRAGDEDLIDVLTMCDYLGNPDRWTIEMDDDLVRKEIVAAALDLGPAISSLRVKEFQSPQRVAGDVVYTGIAVLFKTWQPPDYDLFIDSTFKGSYQALRFARETIVVPGLDEVSWTQYAFEKYPWGESYFEF